MIRRHCGGGLGLLQDVGGRAVAARMKHRSAPIVIYTDAETIGSVIEYFWLIKSYFQLWE